MTQTAAQLFINLLNCPVFANRLDVLHYAILISRNCRLAAEGFPTDDNIEMPNNPPEHFEFLEEFMFHIANTGNSDRFKHNTAITVRDLKMIVEAWDKAYRGLEGNDHLLRLSQMKMKLPGEYGKDMDKVNDWKRDAIWRRMARTAQQEPAQQEPAQQGPAQREPAQQEPEERMDLNHTTGEEEADRRNEADSATPQAQVQNPADLEMNQDNLEAVLEEADHRQISEQDDQTGGGHNPFPIHANGAELQCQANPAKTASSSSTTTHATPRSVSQDKSLAEQLSTERERVARLQAEALKSSGKLSQYESDLSSKAKTIKTLESNNSDYKLKLEAAEKKNKELKTSAETALTTAGSHKSTLEQTKKEYHDFKAAAEEAISKHCKQQTESEQRVKDLEAKMEKQQSSHEEEVRNLKSASERAASAYKAKVLSIEADAKKEATAYKEELRNLKAANEGEASVYKDKIRSVEDGARKEKNAFEGRIKNLETTIEQQNSTYSDNIRDLKTTAEGKASTYAQGIEALEETIREQTSAYSKEISKLNLAAKNEVAKCKETISELEGTVRQNSADYKRMLDISMMLLED